MKISLFKFFKKLEKSNRFTPIILLAFIFLLSNCSNDQEDFNYTEKDAIVHIIDNARVSQEDAVDIANKVLNKDISRGLAYCSPVFDYVLSKKLSRGSSKQDTLAYIINYPDDRGFVIVSTDRRIYPVLAFSDKGNFSCENVNAKMNFIDKIEAYLSNIQSDTLYYVNEDDFDGCYVIEPMIKISLGQRSPWNKYVVEENPGCPVGCVAVATALVMSHSKIQMDYHNSTYHLQSMINAINKGRENITSKHRKIIGDDLYPTQPTYTYEQAVDSMAKLLYWIGKDVGMIYNTDVSLATSRNAYKLCLSLGFSVPSGYVSFDIKKITQYLRENHIVYLRGNDNKGGGHAWVSDACYFCVNPNDSSEIIDTYIRCDWGWSGLGNGYFSGSVFDVLDLSYSPSSYFAVKRY